MNIKIGKFEQVKDLSDIWPDGQKGFVSWFSMPENLKTISDFLGP